MKIKRFFLALTLMCTITTESFASIMGDIEWSSMVDFGAGSNLYSSAYKNGTVNQQEYFVEYIPNREAIPVVLNGEQIYGSRTILQAAKYYDALNYRPLLGINADYFSYKTGIPMGHTISQGRLLTKDDTGQNAVGFRADGTGFISWLEIQTALTKTDGSRMNIECINKWCFKGAVPAYFLTSDFGKETKTSGKFKYVIFSKDAGEIRIGKEAVFTVEDKFDADINIGIPEDQYILVMDRESGNPEQLAFMDSLVIGEKLTMTNEAVYDKELWVSAENGLGSIGGRLIENGKVNSGFEKGSAPRTAVGVTADGVIIFYVVDGRQSNYSTGLSLDNLAKRMSELGCVDALNLDGGGSTAIAGVHPGSDTFEVINSPSDGKPRSCANYIFLEDTRTPTGIPKTIVLDNIQNQHYMSGAKQKISVSGVWDSANYKMQSPQVSYELINGEGSESVLNGDTVTLKGTGKTTVKIKSGEAEKELSMIVHSFPDNVKTTDKSGKEITSIRLKKGQNYNLQLFSSAYIGNNKLLSDSSCFNYRTEGNIGYFDGSVFYGDTTEEADGWIIVKVGEYEKRIFVKVVDDKHFQDMHNHWAKDAVNELYYNGIVSGVENYGTWYYNPDNVMTRIEFASLVCKYMNIDINQYNDVKLPYNDANIISGWMTGYAKAMTKLGIINGIDGNFKPYDSLTRAQAVTILGRILPLSAKEYNINAVDENDIPQWADEHFKKLVTNNIIKGYEDNTLRPNQNVTRAEAAMIIYNTMSVV